MCEGQTNQQLDDGESTAYAAAAGKKKDSEEGTDKEQEKVPPILIFGPPSRPVPRTPPGPRLAVQSLNTATENRDDFPDHIGHESREAEDAKETVKPFTENDNTPDGAPVASKISTATTGSPLVFKRSRTPDGAPSSGARVPWDPLKMKSLPPAHRAAWEATPEFFPDDSLGFQSSDNPQLELDFDRWAPQLEDCNEEEKQLGNRPMYLLNYEKKTIVRLIAPLPSDLNQDSLDGAQASISEVGSAEEFIEKDNTNDDAALEEKPAGVISDDIGNESCETEKENGDHAQDDNGDEEDDHHVNGKNGEAETNGTEVEGVVAEKRKSIAEVETPISLSPKKARIEGTEEVTDAPTNGDSVEAVVA